MTPLAPPEPLPFGEQATGLDMTLSPDERRLWVSAVNAENLDLMRVDPPSRSPSEAYAFSPFVSSGRR